MAETHSASLNSPSTEEELRQSIEDLDELGKQLRMDSKSFARTLSSARGFRFGIDSAGVAAALRQLADDIDANRVLVQQVRLIDRADQSDFLQRSLILRIAEKLP